MYSAKKIHDWTSSIVEAVLKALQAVNKPFKYVVTCIIMQKNGAGTAHGIHLSATRTQRPHTEAPARALPSVLSSRAAL